MSSEAYFYLALYRMHKSHQYHWAFFVSPRNDLNEPVEIFQIVQNGGPWENGHQDQVSLMDASSQQSNFACCIPLSPIKLEGLEGLRQVLLDQPVEQGDTPLTPPHPRWSCEQWCMRTLERVVHGGHATVQFTTQHPRWKELFNLNVIMTADRAVSNSAYGTYNGEARVVELVQ